MNYKNNNKFNGRRNSNGRSGGKLVMYKTICDECKQECEVPFKPTGNKPVLCRSCFNEQEHKNQGLNQEQRRNRLDDIQIPLSSCNEELCILNFDKLNNKLDIVLKSLVSLSAKFAELETQINAHTTNLETAKNKE